MNAVNEQSNHTFLDSFQFKDGVHTLLNGHVTLRLIAPNTFCVDRVEIPLEHRRQGRLIAMLRMLVSAANKHSVSLCASISPDERNDDLAEAIMRTFNRVGFTPLELDGEVYRKELEYNPA